MAVVEYDVRACEHVAQVLEIDSAVGHPEKDLRAGCLCGWKGTARYGPGDRALVEMYAGNHVVENAGDGPVYQMLVRADGRVKQWYYEWQ